MKWLAGCATATLLTIGLSVGSSARADDQDILGQIENQVASVASRSSGSIVTIEDLHSIEMEDNLKASFSVRRRGLRHQAIDALSRKSDADVQIAVLAKTGKSGSPAFVAAQKSRTAILGELETLRADLAKSPDVARLNVDIDQGQLDAINSKKARLDAEISQMNSLHKPGSAAMAPLTAARAALALQATEAQAQLAADKQRLQSDPSMKFEIPKAGSGFCIGNGYILTTADVLDGMSEPVVITNDGARIRTTIVGLDNETNIGVLHLNATVVMPALPFADSDMVRAGHFAISIGNQSGSVNAVSLNTISGIRSDGTFSGRRFYPSLLQIAGTVAPGNSGAPVLNSSGKVIGMVVAVPISDWTPAAISTFSPRNGTVPAPGSAGSTTSREQDGRPSPRIDQQAPNTFFRSATVTAGYAMPINAAKPIIDDFIAGKPAQHCWIGVSVTSQITHASIADRLDVVRTVIVNGLYPDSPALKAGVLPGDQIVSINGRPTHDEVDVRIASMKAHLGDTITIVLLRKSGQTVTPMTLTAKADLRPARFPRPVQAK